MATVAITTELIYSRYYVSCTARKVDSIVQPDLCTLRLASMFCASQPARLVVEGIL